MKTLLDQLADDVRRDLENVQRELAPRRSGPMLNTTFSKGSVGTPEYVPNGVLDDERRKDRKHTT